MIGIYSFRNNAIFDNMLANQFCDEIASVLALEENDFPESLMLTGGASFALQDKYSKDLDNIIFKVNNEQDYLKLLDYLDKIELKELIKYANRTYIKFSAGAVIVFILIVLDTNASRVVDYNGISLEVKELINQGYL